LNIPTLKREISFREPDQVDVLDHLGAPFTNLGEGRERKKETKPSSETLLISAGSL